MLQAHQVRKYIKMKVCITKKDPHMEGLFSGGATGN